MKKNVIFTDRSVRSVNLLLKEISKYPLLSKEEEYSLWEQMQNGSEAARKKLICCNLRFVVTIAKKYLWSGLALEDLFQAGATGLTLAANMYDASTGNTLLSFAVWHIKSEIQKVVNTYKRSAATDYLEDTIGNDEDNDMCLLDKLCLEQKYNADWDVRYAAVFEEMKEWVSDKFSDNDMRFWTDYVQMREKGYTLGDVAKKYKVSEERAKQLLGQIMQSLKEEFLTYDSAA